MLTSSPEERFLLSELLEQPQRHDYRYTHAAECNLRQILFKSLARQREDYLRLFFPHGPPADQSVPWSLREAQGAIDGAEYTAAAKGTACGHIFKSGESTYHCKTCAADDTCVLCARCFEASDHEGHAVFISVSPGNSGCCDCGDSEAWRREVKCTIHSADAGSPQHEGHRPSEKDKTPVGVVGRDLPPDLVEAIRTTISRAVDYLCDVFSCSPEQLRLPKTEVSVREDERMARLSGLYGEHAENPVDADIEFALILWNDEKHTVLDVQNQVARACSQSKKFGFKKAMEVNDIGRSMIHFSTDVPKLLRMAEIIEQLKVTVTIRSSRDTFREQMCETIIDWIADIAGCSVGNDSQVLRTIVCEEFLKPWRTGSHASNREIGRDGIDDHETEDNEKHQRQYRRMMMPLQPAAAVRRVVVDRDGNIFDDNDTPIGGNLDDDDDDDEDMDEDQMDYDDEDMDIEDDVNSYDIASMDPITGDAEMDVDFLDDNEDMTEALEATIAGYPPPPPPPNARRRRQILTPTDSEDGDPDQSRAPKNEPYDNVPKTPKTKIGRQRSLRPRKHWLVKPEEFHGPRPEEPCEDLWKRVRLDYLILYDLRLWKVLRIHIRHLYITTVVTIPHFKRILGLRFAGLYTALAQLYLIADREPDHSIINLSIQMLTTPTITQEVVDRGNFLTNLMAILYTFLTTRQVSFPEDVSPQATLAFDAGAITNRRMFHFFLDLRWLFQSEFIHYRMRMEPHYLLQFLDLVKLHQGVCPNVRATGEHVEYESDAWISASMIVKEINKLCKQVAVSFEPKPDTDGDNSNLRRAIQTVAQVVIINSLGREKERFNASEVKSDLIWAAVGPFDDSGKEFEVPKHVVQSEPMSFHHPLHYLLSWLLESGKNFNREEMRALLGFSSADIKDPLNGKRHPLGESILMPADLLSSAFDHPLRVCVWLAQMKAGMWVRNGITLRHQAHTYRSVSHRDVGYQRDIFMIQAGLVLCGSEKDRPGEYFLAQMVDRFQMGDWFQGNFAVVSGFEEAQQIDVIEDFFHLLVIALCERGNLLPDIDAKEQHARLLRHDIAHALCFKPLSYSDLTNRVTEKVSESDDFSIVLESLTNYRPPEGLSDTGTFELKPDYIELVDPYYAHYSRNHREEAESIYKKFMARKNGKPVDDVVYEPTLQPIPSGLFANLSAFTSTPVFVQILATALTYAATVRTLKTTLQVTRIETFLHMALHLALIATTEDGEHGREFVKLAATAHQPGQQEKHSIVSLLVVLSNMDEYASSHPTIKLILRKMQMQQPERLMHVAGSLGAALDRGESSSPASISQEDKERKKQEALARQARVMAQMKQQQNSFLQNQGLSGFGEDIEDMDDMSITDEPEAIEEKKTWSFPMSTCIWCQEDTDDQRLYGTLAFFGESNIVRSTPMEDLDFIKEVIAAPDSLDRSADHLRPFGVAGQNKRTVQKIDADGNVVISERQGLSRGFPHPKLEATGPVATTCGHIMHYSCFELYMQHNHRRHTQQIARNHPENIDLKEFTCPLCKALGNTFLPIVWKAKECAQEHELHATKDFADWLMGCGQTYPLDFTSLEPDPNAGYRPQQAQELSNRSSQYISNNFAPSLVASMNDLSLRTPPSTASTPSPAPGVTRRSSGLSAGLTGWFRSRSSSSQVSSSNISFSPGPEHQSRMAELSKAYSRVDETINANALDYRKSDLVETVNPINPVTILSRSLGLSISAFEIAQRGIGNDPLSTSLIPEIPAQNLTHFRILSETVESYLAINVLRPSPLNPITRETAKQRNVLIARIFGFEEHGGMEPEIEKHVVRTFLLEDDVFLTFVDWLSFMAPNVAEASSMLQLCLWAEVVKTIFTYLLAPERNVLEDLVRDSGDLLPASEAFSTMILRLSERGEPCNVASAPMAVLKKVVDKYALAFLRKAITVMYVRFGLDFECPYNIDPAAPELDRLTKLLHIPSIDDMASLLCGQSDASGKLRQITNHWINLANTTIKTSPHGRSAIAMPHPTIFELVGLPKTYDSLTEEAIRRKCPTTGKEITDPAICLLCGAIFCSQAVCCMKDSNKGGCYQHMSTCGGKIGIFINVRKCMVLFMHGPGNGSFAQAPYLDKHGEPDPTLRRHHQLFLNQRRYDKLMREVWLGHGIPTVISRKLEADINPGGWETL